MAVNLHTNTLHQIRSLHQHTKSLHHLPRSSIFSNSKKFPTNSTSIYQFTTRSLSYYSITQTTPYVPSYNTTNRSPFLHLTQSHPFSSKPIIKNKRKASTATEKQNALNKWNLSHRSRSILRWLGYWSPRIVIMAWGAGFVIGGLYLLKKSIETDGWTLQLNPGTGADINAEDWTMIDHDGVKYSKDDSLGKYLLIYFGFTFCPDVCPVEMTKLAQIADILKQRGIGTDLVQPVFVSVDYRRDTPEMIKRYIKQYTDGDETKIMGLCGTREQMEHFARVMKTYFSDPPQLEEDYILEHSTYMYFTGTDGSFKYLTNTEDGAEVLANKVALWVAEDKGKVSKVVEQVKQAFA